MQVNDGHKYASVPLGWLVALPFLERGLSFPAQEQYFFHTKPPANILLIEKAAESSSRALHSYSLNIVLVYRNHNILFVLSFGLKRFKKTNVF